MAQTVALQRGTTTIQGNGSIQGTLFTQVGGIATRVMLAGFSGWMSGTSNFVKVGLFLKHNGSSTNTTMIGFKMFGNNANTGCYDITPGYENMKNIGFGSNVGASALTTEVIMYGNVAGSSFGSSSYNIDNFATWGQGVAGNSSNQSINTMPQQFWMGPNDVLCAKVFDSNTFTHNITYSFVTITES